VHPVVVLDGQLFRATFDYPGVSVERIDWARVHWSGSQVLTRPVVVDVVTVAALEVYVERLRFSLGQLAEVFQERPGDFRRPGAAGF